MSHTREIGGSTLSLWRSKINAKVASFFQKRADKLHKAGSKTVISNPTCKFINHCTIIFNFTVDNTEKFQLIHEGKFTDKFKNWNQMVADHKLKMAEYDEQLIEWENQDPDNRDATPVKPQMEPYPLDEEMMFRTIISMQKKWYKKGAE